MYDIFANRRRNQKGCTTLGTPRMKQYHYNQRERAPIRTESMRMAQHRIWGLVVAGLDDLFKEGEHFFHSIRHQSSGAERYEPCARSVVFRTGLTQCSISTCSSMDVQRRAIRRQNGKTEKACHMETFCYGKARCPMIRCGQGETI